MTLMIDPRWAWEAYQPSDTNPWNMQKVGHLYRRATFGANWKELQEGLELGPARLLEKIFQGRDGLTDFEKRTHDWGEKSFGRVNNPQVASAWWIHRMLETPHPLKEKITLFWHNHFATSNAKVQNTGYMLGQYDILYRNGLGHFGTMLQEISVDPAMMIWLDTVQSKKGMPNENYARELMELFSLGIGNYTEKDIREAARAFTGYMIENRKSTFKNSQHDASEKTVLGKAGKFKAQDIVQICLEQKACSRFLVRKLFRFFISESLEPSPELLEPLAEAFARDFDIGKLVQKMLSSNLFFSEQAYRSQIKSPIDFVLGMVRGLEGRLGMAELVQVLESLGQNVFHPPSVKGWDGGETWLNGQTLLTRQNFSLTLCQTYVDGQVLPMSVAKKHGQLADAHVVDFFVNLFLQGDIAKESHQRLSMYFQEAKQKKQPRFWRPETIASQPFISLCHLVLLLPEFQLN